MHNEITCPFKEKAEKWDLLEKLHTEWLNQPRKQMGSRSGIDSTNPNEKQVFRPENIIPLFRENKQLKRELDEFYETPKDWILRENKKLPEVIKQNEQ